MTRPRKEVFEISASSEAIGLSLKIKKEKKQTVAILFNKLLVSSGTSTASDRPKIEDRDPWFDTL